MSRAMVIKSYDGPAIAGAIVDGMTRTVTPLDETELATVKAELEAYKARDGVRAYGDHRRTQETRRANIKVYKAKPVNGLTGAILTVWACLWLVVYDVRDRIGW